VEFLFKKNFWLVWFLFLGGIGWLLARLASFIIAANLQITPLAPEVAQPAALANPQFTPTKPQLDIVFFARLLGIELTTDSLAPQESADESNILSRSSINARLLGTLIAFPPRWSLASIQVGTEKPMSFAIGSEIEGASVIAIERERVIVVHNNQREYIDANTPAAAPNPVPSPETSRADATFNIRELAPNTYEIPRNDLEKTLGNLNEISTQARIMPAFKDGASQGYRLHAIRPNSFYQKLGMQNGDIVKRINGYDMNSPEKALELYAKLKDSSRIDLEIERNGSPLKKTYNIRAP